MSEATKDYGMKELPDCIEIVEENPEFFIISGPVRDTEDEMFTAISGDVSTVLTMIYCILERLDVPDLVRLIGLATRELVLPHTTMGKVRGSNLAIEPEEDINKKAREEILQKLVDEGDLTDEQRAEIEEVINGNG